MTSERLNSIAAPCVTGQLACVFGVSGVGKTTLISQFVREHSSWHALSASNLLSGVTNQRAERLRLLDRAEIEANQLLLVEAIQRRRRLSGEAANWLLDAHSVINNDRELVQVPTEIVARLGPSLLIFTYANASQILTQRASDPRRGRAPASIEQIESEQELALLVCRQYSQELQIRLHQISADDPVGFDAALTQKND